MVVGYTPGPWSALLKNKGRSDEHWCVGNAENEIVAELTDYISYPEERDKNAMVVAAAPDLLAACEAIVDGDGDVDKAIRLATLAIRKAKTVTESLD